MIEVKPYMCSCCNDIWSRENQKSIKLGKYELHLCPDCYHEYIISNNAVLEQIRADIEFEVDHRTYMLCAEDVFEIIDKYKEERE